MMDDTRKRMVRRADLPDFGWGDLARAYWELLGQLRWRWLLLMLVLLAVNFYVLVPPLLVGKIVDFFTTYHLGEPLGSFYLYTTVFGISFAVVSFVRLSTKRALGDLHSEVQYHTKVRGFEKLLDFSLAWHLTESAGAKAQRISGGVEAYKAFSKLLQNELVRASASFVGVIAVFLFLQPKYVFFFLLYLAGFWGILTFFQTRIQRENDAYYRSLEQAGGSYVEGLSNILTIKTLGATADFKHHIAQKEHMTKEHEFTIRRYSNNLWKSFQALNGISYGLFLFLVGRDVIAGVITAGSLVVFYGYLQSLVGNATDVMDTYEMTIGAKSGVGRMMSIFWVKTSVTAGTKRLPKKWETIKFDQANFRYASVATSALKNFSLSVPRNAKIGIVGKTGSGKSTLAKLFAGLYTLSSGSYTIGRVSFYELAHEEQTRAVVLVLQETEIFHLSFKENITLLRDIAPDIVENALAIAQLEDVVATLPEGLDTLVGEKGYHLSGGERQRVGIARAICRNAPILILDEATSSLDRKTEVLIQEALEAELADRTIISIAHRVATLEHSDEIFVLDEGAIVERGTYATLSQNPASKFSEIARLPRALPTAPSAKLDTRT